MTRFTNETAFNSIFKMHMAPNILIIIMAIVKQTISAVYKSKPIILTVTMNIASKDMPKLRYASFHIVKYCS